MRTPKITLTGIDQWTNMNALCAIAYKAEIGILITATPEGRPRYPSEPWVGITIAEYPQLQYALHICGNGARTKLKSGHYDPWMKYVKRIQINGVVDNEELIAICNTYSSHTIITQHPGNHSANLSLIDLPIKNHSLLVDGSGGRGVSPIKWAAPTTDKLVGFAGGLGPNEIIKNLVEIDKIAKADYWIDMENKLRTDDKFDVDKAISVVEEVYSGSPWG